MAEYGPLGTYSQANVSLTASCTLIHILCALVVRLLGDFFTDLCWFTGCPTSCVLMGSLCRMTKRPRLNYTFLNNRLVVNSGYCYKFPSYSSFLPTVCAFDVEVIRVMFFLVTFLATILHVARFRSFKKRCEVSFWPLTAQGVHVLVCHWSLFSAKKINGIS